MTLDGILRVYFVISEDILCVFVTNVDLTGCLRCLLCPLPTEGTTAELRKARFHRAGFVGYVCTEAKCAQRS